MAGGEQFFEVTQEKEGELSYATADLQNVQRSVIDMTISDKSRHNTCVNLSEKGIVGDGVGNAIFAPGFPSALNVKLTLPPPEQRLRERHVLLQKPGCRIGGRRRHRCNKYKGPGPKPKP